MPVFNIGFLIIIFPGIAAMLTSIYILKDEINFFLRTGKILNKDILSMKGGYIDKRIEKVLNWIPHKASRRATISNTINILRWNLSEVRLIFLRYVAVCFVFTMCGLVMITNTNISREELIKDMNFGISFIEASEGQMTTNQSEKNNIELERKMVLLVLDKIKGYSQFDYTDYSQLEKFMQSIINNTGEIIVSETQKKRVIKKAILLRSRESFSEKTRSFVGLLLICILVYWTPFGLSLIKKEIIKQKKAKEIIIIYNALMLYKELPPYDPKILLKHLISVSEEYKSEMSELLETIKNGNISYGFEKLVKRAKENSEEGFVDFLEQIKMFYITGKLEKNGTTKRYIEMKMNIFIK